MRRIAMTQHHRRTTIAEEETAREERRRRHGGAVAHAAQQHHQPGDLLRDRGRAAAQRAGPALGGRADHRRQPGVGRRRDRARGALVRRLRRAVRAGLRHALPAPDLAPVAVGAGGQLGRLRQRARGHRAGSVGAAQQGDIGGAHRQALGADLRAHERRQRGGGGRDRRADVAGPAARLTQSAAHAAAGGRGAGDDRGNARRWRRGRGGRPRASDSSAAAPGSP